ncbi:hypothetical protein F4810DRAFT_714384 [Camillea tinctor]|nr:hypothetical protein F4810DRAFT_714384 [Camillea tinctor]
MLGARRLVTAVVNIAVFIMINYPSLIEKLLDESYGLRPDISLLKNDKREGRLLTAWRVHPLVTTGWNMTLCLSHEPSSKDITAQVLKNRRKFVMGPYKGLQKT